MHGPREEVGGNRWPGLTLKITSSIGNKQLSSTPTPPKMLDPLWNQKLHFSELMEYNEGMSNMLGVSIYWLGAIYIHICILLGDTGQWKISETKRPVHVVNCFQLSDKPQSLQ